MKPSRYALSILLLVTAWQAGSLADDPVTVSRDSKVYSECPWRYPGWMKIKQPANNGTAMQPAPVNVRSAKCPDGEYYTLECNTCQCSHLGQSICTRVGCDNWTCEKTFKMFDFGNETCYGHCSCNDTTLVTICERIGCWVDLDLSNQPQYWLNITASET